MVGRKAAFFSIVCLLCGSQSGILAQQHTGVFSDTAVFANQPVQSFSKLKSETVSLHSFFLPAGLIAFGFTGIGNSPVRDFDLSVRDLFRSGHPSFRTRIDDYLQYTPALTVYGLNAAGIMGRHRLKDRSLILGMTMIFSSGMVTALKSLTHKERPDASSYHSFPSGHTATAFAGAEFLRMEFKEVSPWYGVAGYAVAAVTGTLRVLNNRHWCSDVAAGAGFGILSARLSYLVFSEAKKHADKKKENSDVSVIQF